MTTSTTIFGTAFPMKKSLKLMQVGGGSIHGSQNPLIGLQAKIAVSMTATAHAIVIAPTTFKRIAKILPGKSSAHRNKMEIFVTVNVPAYMISPTNVV